MTHESRVRQVAFSPDQSRLLTVSDDTTARLWRVASGEPLSDPMRHDDVVLFGAFSPDGRFVVTGGYDGTARVWHTDCPDRS